MDCNYVPPPQDWIDRPAIHERYEQSCHYVDQDEVDRYIDDIDSLWFPGDATKKTENSLSLEMRFSAEALKWESETEHISSPNKRMMHPSYQAILGMGKDVIPLLLRDLRDNRRAWFSALSYLTTENPINREDAGKMDRMIDAWVNWGRSRGLL